MAKLVINYPNLAAGTKVVIPAIPGDFANGETYEIESLEEDLLLGTKTVSSETASSKTTKKTNKKTTETSEGDEKVDG